jgi:hypothetical protein
MFSMRIQRTPYGNRTLSMLFGAHMENPGLCRCFSVRIWRTPCGKPDFVDAFRYAYGEPRVGTGLCRCFLVLIWRTPCGNRTLSMLFGTHMENLVWEPDFVDAFRCAHGEPVNTAFASSPHHPPPALSSPSTKSLFKGTSLIVDNANHHELPVCNFETCAAV